MSFSALKIKDPQKGFQSGDGSQFQIANIKKIMKSNHAMNVNAGPALTDKDSPGPTIKMVSPFVDIKV